MLIVEDEDVELEVELLEVVLLVVVLEGEEDAARDELELLEPQTRLTDQTCWSWPAYGALQVTAPGA